MRHYLREAIREEVRQGLRELPRALHGAGRAGDPHGRETDPGLLEIQVRDVLAAARRVRTAPVPRSSAAPAGPDADPVRKPVCSEPFERR